MADLIFKGATRPAMKMGIPILPLVLVAGLDFIITMWVIMFVGFSAGLIVLLIGAGILFTLRLISKSDDHRLNQLIMRLMSSGYRRQAPYWGAHSASPIDYKKRS